MRNLSPHPQATIFPMLGGNELSALADDIKKHGLNQPIVLNADGTLIIDGRNRLAACEIAGIEPTFKNLDPRADELAFIISQNLMRRHLTAEQRREVVRLLLLDRPERSDRATAKIAKVSHSTVAAVRGDLEANGQIGHNPQRAEETGRIARGNKPAVAAPQAGREPRQPKSPKPRPKAWIKDRTITIPWVAKKATTILVRTWPENLCREFAGALVARLDAKKKATPRLEVDNSRQSSLPLAQANG